MRGWRRSGAARRWPGAGRRDGSSSPSGFRTSTRARRTPQASLGFPRQARITRSAEFQRVAREGKRLRAGHLDVRVVASPPAHPAGRAMRVGLIVPRYKHSAVARNQLKRRLRELVRLQLLPVACPADIVLRIRPEAYDASFDMLADDMTQVLTGLRRWSTTASSGTAVAPETSMPAEG